MKILHKVFGFILFAVLLALCVHVIRAFVHGHWASLVAGVVQLHPVSGLCGAVVLLCLVALYLLTGISPERRAKLLSFDNEGGTVSISTEAVCDYIVKLAPEFPSIARLVPEVITSRNSIDIVVGVRVKAGPQIHEVCELLQQRVRESMTNGLGIAQVRRVEVRVTDIVSEHRPL